MRDAEAPQSHPAVAALLEAGRRAARGGVPRSVLLLHLGAVAAPRPHHGRVARAILTDVADRLEGEVLRLPGGDLALLCPARRVIPDPIGPEATGPQGLPAVLSRLFATAELAGAPLCTVWRLPDQNQALHDLLTRPIALADPAPTSGRAPSSPPAPAVLSRQTAARLRTLNGTPGLEPCFHELRIVQPPPQADDPFLARHAADHRDRQTLAILAGQVARTGTLAGAATDATGHLPVHVDLEPQAILSPAFDQLAAACTQRAIRLGIEIPFLAAVADPEAFHAASARLLRAGALLILDDVAPGALALTRPAALAPDLLKLVWQPTLARLTPAATGAVAAAIREIGPSRLVLDGADTDAAMAWGREAGITRFQGRHVDAMLAAARITAGAHAGLLELRDRIDQALATAPPGPAGRQEPRHHPAA